MKPQDSLRESADVFDERFKIYGAAYKRFGPVMAALFPNGVGAFNAHDMNRLGIVVQIVSKMTRYAGTFEVGGHDDSLLDLSTYAAMLRELDAEGRSRPKDDGAPESFEAMHDRADEIAKETMTTEDFLSGQTAPFSPKLGRPAWEAEMEIEPVVPRRQTDFEKEVEDQARREMIRE